MNTLKNMKLVTKIILGYTCILFLLAAVVYVGYDGMSGIVDRADKADDVNRLVINTIKAR